MSNILFVEDETYEMIGVLNTLRQKHRVSVQADGASALREIRVNHEKYDLVILDLMLPRGRPQDAADEMPEMNTELVGEYIFGQMGTLCPDLPVIILTAARSDMLGLRSAPNVRLIQKPVRMAHLMSTIAEMLGPGSLMPAS
jgi:CheY-like chemotaxis protein